MSSSGFHTMVSVCRHERVIVTVRRHGILTSTPWGISPSPVLDSDPAAGRKHDPPLFKDPHGSVSWLGEQAEGVD